MPFGFLQGRAAESIVSIFGQLVKVKNTFLDDVVQERQDEADTSQDRAAQTCPEFGRQASPEQATDVEDQPAEAAPEAACAAEPTVECPPGVDTLPRLLSTPAPVQMCMMPAPKVTEIAEESGSSSYLQQLREHGQSFLARQGAAGNEGKLGMVPSPPPQHAPKIQQAGLIDPVAAAAGPAFPPPAMAPQLQEPIAAAPGPAFPPPAMAPQLQEPIAAAPAPAYPPPSMAPQLQGLSDCQPDAPRGGKAPQERGKSVKDATTTPTRKHKAASRRHMQTKIWCHLFLDPAMIENGFDLAKKTIGHGGVLTKSIFEATGAKIRLRGKGSGHKETKSRGEAPVPLMLAVTSEVGQECEFLTALRMSAELLEQVTSKFKDYCKYYSLPKPHTPLFWIGDLSENAHEVLHTTACSTAACIEHLRIPMSLESAQKHAVNC
eukprot:TRINITY_DN2976_c0_g1_i1.p1 TRINITY_DN2976_c0_g1~~TRINITY_DN2976_c0_g1_i1.p1  ORF type:complete len:434 (+),score=97.86 TRINITY_DN2976_c0_g1_i1:57-1358(+)